jgi:hypothetical protein
MFQERIDANTTHEKLWIDEKNCQMLTYIPNKLNQQKKHTHTNYNKRTKQLHINLFMRYASAQKDHCDRGRRCVFAQADPLANRLQRRCADVAPRVARRVEASH